MCASKGSPAIWCARSTTCAAGWTFRSIGAFSWLPRSSRLGLRVDANDELRPAVETYRETITDNVLAVELEVRSVDGDSEITVPDATVALPPVAA